MRSINLWYEMVMLVFMLICGATALTSVVVLMNEPIISYTAEKTALDSFDIENIIGHPRYGKDLLASLINTDENVPYPNAIKIDNSPVLLLDNSFHTKKFAVISQVYNPSGDYQLGAKLNVPIKAMRFEVIDGRDVMHYYLSNNPPN